MIDGDFDVLFCLDVFDVMLGFVWIWMVVVLVIGVFIVIFLVVDVWVFCVVVNRLVCICGDLIGGIICFFDGIVYYSVSVMVGLIIS